MSGCGHLPDFLFAVVRLALDGDRFSDHYDADIATPSGMSGERIGTDSLQPTLGAAPDESDNLNVIEESNKGNNDVLFISGRLVACVLLHYFIAVAHLVSLHGWKMSTLNMTTERKKCSVSYVRRCRGVA